MEKEKEKLMFVKFTGTAGGTMMEKRLKHYAMVRYDRTIIKESQLGEIEEDMREMEELFHEGNPQWKRVKVEQKYDLQGIEVVSKVGWVYVGGEAALTATAARLDYSKERIRRGKENRFPLQRKG